MQSHLGPSLKQVIGALRSLEKLIAGISPYEAQMLLPAAKGIQVWANTIISTLEERLGKTNYVDFEMINTDIIKPKDSDS